MQTTCRALNWPRQGDVVDEGYGIYGIAMPPAKLEHGTYIKGLYFEGAGWFGLRRPFSLKRQEPKVLVVPLPILEMIPSGGAVKLHGVFVTPVYVTQDRRNAMGVGLVFEANLATDEHTSLWVLQGVALSLNAVRTSPGTPWGGFAAWAGPVCFTQLSRHAICAHLGKASPLACE